MCGIAGIINLDGSEIDPKVLDRLTDAIAHRGPDGRGTYVRGNVGLGHRRLKIIDLTDAAAQPMISEDGSLALVFNGEIYNFQELRGFLETRGHRFKSSGDTEVLLKLYAEEGEKCIGRLRGMFAFAIHDRARNKVTIVRDRVGKKPIKYFTNGKIFAFASELKALKTLPECPKEPDEEAIHHFLTMMYLPSPLTGLKGIRKLSAATLLSIDTVQGTVSEESRYWSLSYDPDKKTPVPEWKSRIFETLDESVRLRMISDVPIGAFLSGGIDSAAAVGFMARHSPYPVKTFSIGSKSETHNELPFARLVADWFRTDHHPIVLEPDIVHLLPELVQAYEEPYADPSAIPTFLISRETRSEVTVALNGDGGDENFAGYVRYPILKFSRLWERFPAFVHRMALWKMRILHRLSNSTFSYRCLRFQEGMPFPWPLRYLRYLSFFTDEEKRRLYGKNFGKSFPATDVWYASLTAPARSRAGDSVHQAMAMDFDTYLADDLLPKVDLGSMAHGLEARSPLLDHKLLELTARIPVNLKLKGFQTKWIFKEILSGFLPDEILTKRKTGFRLPLDRWFRAELKPFVTDRLLSQSSPLYRFLDRPALEQFLNGYFSSHIDFSDHIWALLWLDEWMRQF